MRAFMLVCFITAATAQYHYAPQSHIDNDDVLGGNIENDSPVGTHQVEGEYSKSFYTYSAPEQEFEDLSAGEHIVNSLKKSLRVIFIKSPENTALETAALQLAKGATDERTAIYVLNKQTDISSLANQLQQHKSNNAFKPEVHFVKYRTQADAENAQRIIQAQYDNLPGITSNNHDGSVPVLDFASKSGTTATFNNAAPTTPSTRSYLPPRNLYLPPRKKYQI